MAVVIGFLMLMGIVTKNAIMLVEFALSAMDAGAAKRDAILDAVHKRARPIVMTTVAMGAGMLPSAYGVGDGGDASVPSSFSGSPSAASSRRSVSLASALQSLSPSGDAWASPCPALAAAAISARRCWRA